MYEAALLGVKTHGPDLSNHVSDLPGESLTPDGWRKIAVLNP